MWASVCKNDSPEAYHAHERDGLVFAYTGPPDEKPEFPELRFLKANDGKGMVWTLGR